jgi:LmbE family N-acetylglucosaminyl deacetylase
MKKILILAAHMDDEVWCAGTVNKWIEQGDTVCCAVFSDCDNDKIEDEFQESIKILGIQCHLCYTNKVRRFSENRQNILEHMIKIRDSIKPDIVLTHATFDFHQDHQVISEEAIRAFKHSTILGFELCWNNIDSDNNCFVELSHENVSKKIEAGMCYQSQSSRPYFNEEFIRGWSKMRGIQNGCDYAEAFEVIKLKL